MRRQRVRVIAAGLVVTGVLALAGCGSDAPGVSPLPNGDPGPIHVHGLGINPADGALFIATHTGLFRSADGESTATRVTDRRQDTMGFTVAGRDRFLGSGHPDLRDGLPPFLGLIKSDDAGRSWRPVSLLGKADFHALRVRGDRVVGYDSRSGRLMVSADGGRRWAARRVPEPLVDVVMSPDGSESLLAAGERLLHHSSDGGRSWRRTGDTTGLLAWTASNRLYLLEQTGRLSLSRDAGARWQRVGEVQGEPAALLATDAAELYVALHDGTILRSADGGVTWTLRSAP